MKKFLNSGINMDIFLNSGDVDLDPIGQFFEKIVITHVLIYAFS